MPAVLGLMADHNIERHLDAVLAVCRGPLWRGLWDAIGVTRHSFAGLGLAFDASDAKLWRACQAREILLVTANRNQQGVDSLESTIRASATVDSLPVLTLADASRVLRDRPYAARVAERLIDICMDVDDVRGAGRLYLPAR